MSFGILAMIVLAGLAGPLLAAGRRPLVPVVVGELAAGVVIGISGFRWLDPTQPTIAFLAQIGFAMLMFAAGMSVPLREPGLVSGLRRGGVTAVIAALLAVPFGIIASRATGAHHAAVYALLLASGSAAILLPALKEHGLMGDQRALTVMAQVALADIAAIVALPLVLRPGHALRAALGGLLVAACVLLLYGVTRLLNGTAVGARGAPLVEEARLGARSPAVAARPLRARLDCAAQRHERAHRRLRRRTDGRRDRRAETALAAGRRRRDGLHGAHLLRRPRCPPRPSRPLAPPLADRARGAAARDQRLRARLCRAADAAVARGRASPRRRSSAFRPRSSRSDSNSMSSPAARAPRSSPPRSGRSR